jgi:parallel beta-helix repeat protein
MWVMLNQIRFYLFSLLLFCNTFVDSLLSAFLNRKALRFTGATMYYNPRLLLVFLLLVGVANAQTVYVSGTGDPCNLGGAYTTIQEAIDAADAGDAIIVCADAAYTENFVANKSVDIRPDDPEKTVVVRAGTASSPVFTIGADHVNITNFILKDATGSYGLHSTGSYGNILQVNATNNDIGFYLEGSSHNNLSSNIAHDNIDEGFRLASDSDNNLLTNNTAFNQLYYGFYLDSSSNNRLVSNTAYNSSSWYGFFLYSGARYNELVNNTAYSNGHHGFHIYLNSDNNLSGNDAYNNSMEGFRISSSDDNVLKDNTAYNNTAEGFMISSSSGNLMEGNDAYDNLLSGFLISSSSGNEFKENTAYNNSLYGFHLHLSSQNRLSSNEAYNQEDGFHVFGGSDNLLYSNRAHDNSNGFYLDSSTSNELDSNTAYDNGIHGFLFSSSSDNNISGNVAHDNLQHGFYNYLGSNELEDNTAYGNLNGFLISSSPNNELSNNTAYSNTNSGIYLYLGSSNTVIGNIVYNNSLHGFYLYESPRNELKDNIAKENSQNGFLVYLSPNSNLSDNTAFDNLGNGFDVSSGSRTSLSGNTAYGNMMSGLYIHLSADTQMTDNTAYSNAFAGTYILDSRSSALEGDHYYNNTIDFGFNSSVSPLNVDAQGMIIDNPAGSYGNFTNISIVDRLLPGSAYSLKWASQPATPPHPHVSFEGKYLEITADEGSVSIDDINWSWLETEVGSRYRESEFKLWRHDGSGWLRLNASLDTSFNTLSLSALVPGSVYAILQNRTLPSFAIHNPGIGAIVNTSQTNLSWTLYSFDPTANCSLILDSDPVLDLTAVSGERNDYLISLEEDSYLWSVTCTDSVGTNSSQTMGFTVDFPPSVSLDDPDPEYINTTVYDLGFIASDNISSTLNCSLFIDGAFDQAMVVADSVQSSFQITGLNEGSHDVQVLCEDGSGNTGSSGAKEIVSDQSAPTISLISPPDGYVGNDSALLFNFSANDSLSPTLNYSLYIDDNLVGSGQDPYFSIEVPEGTHNWSIIATDMAGNANESETRDFLIDRSAPYVEITDPTDEPVIITSAPANVNLTFNVSDDISSMLNCSLYLNDVFVQNMSIPTESQDSFALISLPEGLHEAYILCTDETGNSGSSGTKRIIVDYTPPSLEVISPDDGHLSSDSMITFSFNATDQISANVTSSLYIDGNLRDTTYSNFFTFSVPEGIHNWSIISTDEAGNTNTSQQRGLTVDSSAPTITIHAPGNRRTIISSSPIDVTFNFTAADNLSSQMVCTAYLDGLADYTNSSVQDGVPVDFIRTLDHGRYTWWIECSDEANNTRSSPLQTITVASSLPSDDDDDDDEPTISISWQKNCPENTMTFTVSSGSRTSMRLYDSENSLTNFSRSDGNGEVTFPISQAGRYEIRASKSSYRTNSREFSYSLCYVPPDDGGGDDGKDDGGDDTTPGNETGSDDPPDPVIPDEPPQEEPPPNDDPPPGEVEIIVNDTAYQGDDVSVRVVLDDTGVRTPLLLLSPANERRVVMTDESGRASFKAEELGRYRVSVDLPDVPLEEAIIQVVQKDGLLGSALSEFRLPLCISFILPFLILLFLLMATFTYFAAREEGRKSKGKYRGFRRKKEGVTSRIKGLLKKE